MKSFAEIDIDQQGSYLKLLSAVSQLSGLFSESAVPFINYRVAENIFCRSFNAENLSRSDTAFDANYNSLGVGLKTFVCTGNSSTEKVAEFNSLSQSLQNLKGKALALKLGEYRNDRINLANRNYKIDNSIYHIVARKEKELLLYETDYNIIDLDNIHSVKNNKSSLQFEDGNHLYTFNYSKSTLFRKFIIPDSAFRLPIDIIEDPYSLLLELFEENKNLKTSTTKLVRGENYVILPLFSTRNLKKIEIAKSSGLNAWHAKPRENQERRPYGEMYIPIPQEIHKQFPDFFPKKDSPFNLEIPTGEIFSAKVCQENSKALMTNPNSALEKWLLRDLLQLEEGELATIEKLNKLGFDSVIVTKENNENFKIDIMKTNSYLEFINGCSL
ncbi:MAG: restriction endonuclease [Flavobacterium nitrogenifigens]|uniref:restriction endonuclease n=1 Tax=Flavobacterium nitrogenifigens TaxID=1617283 RepID=UPI00280942F4|nr:restriction endonuclease [Flavobacterium nitrogenifigens]MDQ8011883.1 restriction endonuclease [Flavobacterium nitrogenifigens]